MTWQDESIDFMCDFDDFIDLNVVVCSDAINNIKNKWIASDFDELYDEIIDWRKELDGHVASWQQVVILRPLHFLV